MEQKGKTPIKFNIVDRIVIVLLILALVLVGWKMRPRKEEVVVPTVPMTKATFQYKVEGVDPALYENCKKHLPSTMLAGEDLLDGQIESVEKESYYVLTDNGKWVEDPNHVTLVFTASVSSPKLPVLMARAGKQEIRIGKTDYTLKSEHMELIGGTIIDVQWED